MSLEYNLEEILEEYFGDRGDFLLACVLKDLNMKSIDSLDTEQKTTLAETIMSTMIENNFSERHYSMIKHKIYKSLGLDPGEQVASVED